MDSYESEDTQTLLEGPVHSDFIHHTDYTLLGLEHFRFLENFNGDLKQTVIFYFTIVARGSIFAERGFMAKVNINIFKVIIGFLSGGLFPKLIGESIHYKTLCFL